MIIQRDTVGRIHRAKDGRYYFETRFEDGTVLRAREQDCWSPSAFRALDRQQKRKPVGLLNMDDLSWWMYKGKIYLTEGNPRPTEVASFLDCRQIVAEFRDEPFFPKDTAFKFKTIGKRKPPGVPSVEIAEPATSESLAERKPPRKRRLRRQDIPDRVKMFVWRRDERRCVKCGTQELLEFDHIIPLSKGGSNTARNLQLLCERCNRKKAASIA